MIETACKRAAILALALYAGWLTIEHTKLIAYQAGASAGYVAGYQQGFQAGKSEAITRITYEAIISYDI